MSLLDWREVSAVNGVFPEDLSSNPEPTSDGSQLPVTIAPGDSDASEGMGTHVHITTYKHIIEKYKIKNHVFIDASLL